MPHCSQLLYRGQAPSYSEHSFSLLQGQSSILHQGPKLCFRAFEIQIALRVYSDIKSACFNRRLWLHVSVSCRTLS
jgi:hypothetical protein